MVIYDNVEVEDDFDITKITTDLTPEAKEIMSILDKKVYIIDNIIAEGKRLGEEKHNPEYYKIFYQEFYNTLIFQLLHGFEHKEFREHPVYFKFHEDKDEPLKHLEFRYFVVNIAFWYPLITVEPEKLNDEHIITPAMGKKMSTSLIANYMNKYYAKPYAKVIDYRTRSETFADTNYLLMKIPLKFNSFLGLSISIEEFRDMANRMPDFKEGLYVRLDETKQPAEQEAQKHEFDTAQINRVKEDELLTTVKAMVVPKAVKYPQLAEFISIIGNKPDENGKTIPKPINNNYLTGNLGSVDKYYINNISGRKAAVINHEYMGPAGHVLIMTALLSASAKLSKTVDDCNTSNLIPIEVKSDTHLKKLDGRTYKLNSADHYRVVDYENDKDLIGTYIWLRSPITCAAPDGVCKACYGELYHTNKDLYSAGCYAAFEQLNPLVQGLLSAKHFQGTSSKIIDFGPEFEKYLIIATTDVILNPDLEDMELYSLVILADDISSSDYSDDFNENSSNDDSSKKSKKKKKKKKKSEEGEEDFSDFTDDEMEFRLNYYTPKFYIAKNLHSKKKELLEITEFMDPNTQELYMHDDLIARMTLNGKEDGKEIGLDGDYFYLDFEDISFEEYIFMVDVINNELTVPMKKMQALINNGKHAGATTYEEMAQMMLDLTIESGFDATAVHGEMILRQLVRRPINQQLRPNFERVVMPDDYVVLSVITALKQNPSFSVSLSASYLKYQFIQLTSTFDKRDISDLDWWYRRRLAIDENELYYSEESVD
jgi:hypothetical protein